MKERLITERQEQTCRLVHHDFEGLTLPKAAAKMGITVDAVYKLLQHIRKTAPQLFPILSAEHAEIWHLWHNDNLTCRKIAALKGASERSVQEKLCLIKKKMGYQTPQKPQILSWDWLHEYFEVPRRVNDKLSAIIKRKF